MVECGGSLLDRFDQKGAFNRESGSLTLKRRRGTDCDICVSADDDDYDFSLAVLH